jgi:CBS domain-containing protein
LVTHEAQDESGEPYVWGIVSDLDLMRAALRGDETEAASALASEPMVTVKPDMPLKTAAALMVKNQVTHLVVIDPHTLRPVGVLSSTDVAEAFAWGER